MLRPASVTLQLHAAALLAAREAHGSLDAAAATLERMGYDVAISSTTGGALTQLKHRFLEVRLTGRHKAQ